MASTAVNQGSVRQRNTGSRKSPVPTASPGSPEIDSKDKAIQKRSKKPTQAEYGIGLACITGLAFLTRFWGISHPNEVVFDEVHFGKVCWTALPSFPLLPRALG